MKVDPIIAVHNVHESSKWYECLFNCKRIHGGDHFSVLADENNEILLCLHKWGEQGHPTMKDASITAGNGLILYFKTENPDRIRKNVEEAGFKIEEEMHVNTNSLKKEFSLRDPDGYYITITEYHEYEG